jgi:N-acetylneuraminic acid mutarotase
MVLFIISITPLIAPDEPCRSYGEDATFSVKWTAKANLPLPHRNGKAVASGGRIYFMGGYCPETEEEREASNYEYNPQKDSWAAKAKIPVGRSNFAIASFGARIFVVGGDPVLPNNDLYVTDEDRWRKLAPLLFPRQHIDGARIDGKIYVVGGLIRDPNPPADSGQLIPKVATRTVEVYDIDENKWSLGRELPEARHGVQVAVFRGKLYSIGGAYVQTKGQAISSAFERYDPESNTWESLPELPVPLLAPGLAVIKEMIFVLGGTTIENGSRAASDKVYVFDTGKNKWRTASPLPKRIQFPSVAEMDNRIYVIGGCDSEFNAYDSVYEGILIDKNFF